MGEAGKPDDEKRLQIEPMHRRRELTDAEASVWADLLLAITEPDDNDAGQAKTTVKRTRQTGSK